MVGVAPDTPDATLAKPDTTSPQWGVATIHVNGTHLVQITISNYNTDPVGFPDRLRVAHRSVQSSISSLDSPGVRLHDGY